MHHPPRLAERERNMGLSRGDGKHGTCGPPERRPVERKRSRPGGVVYEQKISLTFCGDKPSIMPTIFCTKGGEIMVKSDFLNEASYLCIRIIRQADMISAGRFF